MEKASKRNNYHYNKKLQHLAKANKKRLNRSAATMWTILKNGNIYGYKFRRERPILNYIVDFVCLELMLIIEVDGLSHMDSFIIEKDNKKDEILTEVGFNVMRFDALYVLDHAEDAMKDVLLWVEEHEKKN